MKRLAFLLFLLSSSCFAQADWYHTPVAPAIPFEDAGFAADNVQAAIIEAKQNAEGFPRAGISLISNGTQGNGDWVTYSELTPDVVITFPVNTKINELTWANSKTGVNFDLEFYKNGIAAGNLFYTFSVPDSGAVNYGYVASLNYTFSAGDYMRIKYIDQGNNTSDLVVTVWISRIP